MLENSMLIFNDRDNPWEDFEDGVLDDYEEEGADWDEQESHAR